MFRALLHHEERHRQSDYSAAGGAAASSSPENARREVLNREELGYVNNFAEPHFYHTIARGGKCHVVNYPIVELSAKVFEEKLMDALKLISDWSNCACDCMIGYLLCKKSPSGKATEYRLWYGGSNSRFCNTFLISGPSSIRHQVGYVKEHERYLVNKFLNAAPDSSYVFRAWVNMTFQFVIL